MENYEPNSHKSKEEKKKQIQKVIDGQVNFRKKSYLEKFICVFFPDDLSKTKQDIMYDIIVPLLKKGAVDAFNALIYGGEKISNERRQPERVSYNRMWTSDRRDASDTRVYINRDVYKYEDITFRTRGEAERVLEELKDWLSQYKTVSVADFYECVGVTSNYTDRNYGWTNLRNASIDYLRGGSYVINFPRALPLD